MVHFSSPVSRRGSLECRGGLVLFYSVLFCSALFSFLLFCSPLYSILCSSVLFSSLFCSLLLCSPLFSSPLFSSPPLSFHLLSSLLLSSQTLLLSDAENCQTGVSGCNGSTTILKYCDLHSCERAVHVSRSVINALYWRNQCRHQ